MTENAKPNLSSEGHRHRVRERFLRGGGRDMADYELLEAYLMIAIPRRDVKPIAKALIAKFGSFADVINAPQSELLEVDGIGENSVFALKMVSAAAVRMSWEQLKGADLPVIGNMDMLVDYCRMSMCYQDVEEFRIIYLNSKNQVVDQEIQQISHRSLHRIRKEKRSTFFNAIPVPFATECKGSSAIWKGILILSVKRLSNPRNKAPPPAK